MNAKLVGTPQVELTLSVREAQLLRCLLGASSYNEGVETINNSGAMRRINKPANKEEVVGLFCGITSALDNVI